MALRYELSPRFKAMEPDSPWDNDKSYVEVLSDEEFKRIDSAGFDKARSKIATLLEAESCYVDIFPEYIIGSIAVPDKDDLRGDRNLFSFFWTKSRLVFIDESNIAVHTMQRVANTERSESMTTASCLYLFLRELLAEDHTWLGDLEDKMEDLEEKMLDSGSPDLPGDINTYRRATVRMTNYYRQLGEMALVLAGNDYSLMSPEDANLFNTVVGYTDRLIGRSENIREYSLQLRELHQTQIDMQQNNTMQLLTIVTVILAPLTLIAGWFGMNFTNIPGVNEPWGFPVICAVGAVLTLILIFYFHKKRWI